MRTRSWQRFFRLGTLIGVCAGLVASGCEKKPADPKGSAKGGGGDPVVPFVLRDPALVERNNRAVGLMGRFEYGPAREAFAAIVEEHPGWLDAKVNLAIATFNRQQEGDEETGLRLLHEVLAADPDHLRAHYCSGLLALRAGRVEEALKHFQTVAEADPDDAYAAYSVAQCLEGADDERALQAYLRAIELDPYMRSAYYRAFQMLQRAGQREKAQQYFDDFQRLEKNPRAHLVAVKYTRMGKKAEVLAVGLDDAPAPVGRPEGPLFEAAAPLVVTAEAAWRRGDRTSITTCDVDGNGRLDLFVSGAAPDGGANAVLLDTGQPDFRLAADHPLASITGVNAALWGDYDNDGLTDVYLCRVGPNQLWRQTAPGAWSDVTGSTGTAGGTFDTVDGAFADVDHDGDLDLFCANADGPNELLNNNLDGTFRPIGSERGLAGIGVARHVLIADLDRDRDVDIVVINESPPHEVYRNDRLWAYTAAEGFDVFRERDALAAVAADVDADGAVELYTLRPDHAVERWMAGDDGAWTNETLVAGGATAASGSESGLAAVDVDGDGRQEILASGPSSWRAIELRASGASVLHAGEMEAGRWLPVNVDPGRGPSIVGLAASGRPTIWRPGAGRFAFADLRFSGKHDTADAMRTNASGIGTHLAARVGSRWSVASTLRSTAGPGQSLQPVAIGLGGAAKIDFVAIDWSDGVFQSELDVPPVGPHDITETQRQLSSCPVLFAWNGTSYAFVSDVLGVGGIGFLHAPGVYSEPRPWERFAIPAGSIAPREGVYHIKIGEPMEEVCYLDAATLVAYDLPPGWQMTLDERMHVSGPAPTGAAVFYRMEITPRAAVNDRGEDVTSAIEREDAIAAAVGETDPRFLGRLAHPHVLTVEFSEPIDHPAVGAPVLVIDGWVEYPYSQTMFAAWQAGAEYDPPTLSARDADGVWHVVQERFGYPAGMPRGMSMPLEGLPPGTTALRLATNLEIYWDRIAVVLAEPCPDVRRTRLEPSNATLARTGFARRTTGPQRRPHYDYDRRDPLWDTRHQRGFYTQPGPVLELVERVDDALAILGPGEEVHLEFPALVEPPSAGWSRRIVLDAAGWCKDMDLFTRDGETVGPLPARDPPSGPRERLHRGYNTRYESGR